MAQEGSLGNTTVFGGAQMTFFGNLNFLTGGVRVPPGVILTERAQGNLGVVNFVGDGITVSGATNIRHVDGYVRKYGTGRFVFPVGDNGHVGQFAATDDNVMGAYFFANPGVAVTSDVFTGRNYAPLPGGAPFNTASKARYIENVSNVEYWDIDGPNPTSITLTWDAESNIAVMTGNSLTKLCIVGWNGTEWSVIPSTVNPTSVLGGASTLASGSITTNATLVPDTYSAYTLASAGIPNLTPTTDINSLNFVKGASRDFVVNIFEVNGTATSGRIRFRIVKPSGFTITYPTSSGVSQVFGGTANENGNWDFSENSGFVTVTAKEGINIAANGQAVIGFHVARNGNTSGGTTQNITATIVSGSGGEIKNDDNSVVTNISAF
ncbi:MAG: hypothetical protein BGO21_07975 [Dyadobacter sp. 50-39]|uniref:hypothetical protein n=1 Tax=Dyadobacter sp. 50-39 TaxID=1895756 RepID=UPI00095A03D5|nr:hypothetical protein [Dyadobacter sp. 50-39]OJV20507.1 MAG: hypothetical protein BGO21_07975 [Dyadobacter sp. 50-39]